MTDQQYYSGGGGRGRFASTPVTKWLLVLNVVAFFVDIAGVGEQSWGRLTPHGAYTIYEAFYQWELWRLLTFQFLHADLGHLLFNMVAVYFFAGVVEKVLGTLRFVAFYLLSGVGGALFYSLLVQVGWLSPGVLVGASAGIFGIIMAMVMIAPDLRVMLIFPPVPMKMRTLGIVVLAIGAITVLTAGRNAGGEAGHLGGALVGFLLMKLFTVQAARGTQVRRGGRGTDAEYVPKIRPRTTVSLENSEVDEILDKVSEQGLHSLTEDERKVLKEFSEKE